MSKRAFAIAAILLACAAVRAHAWPWNTDMYSQPSVKPQQDTRKPPPDSQPVTGREKTLSREAASKELKNPIKADARSLSRGKPLFMTYCSPCHGVEAKGDGPVTKKFPPPPDLHLDIFRKRTDGWIYATIRDGGPLMPAYGEALSERERWDVVNYLRKLQSEK